SPRLPWAINPAQFLSLGHWAPFTYLAAVQVAVDGTERLDGVETVRISWSSDVSDHPGASRRGLYWIAPALGYAVVRTQSSRRPAVDMAWKVVEENRSEGFKEYAGVWLPARVHYFLYAYYDDGHYELSREIIASFKSWIVNQTLDAKTFRVEFPAGTLVTDFLNGGRSYVKGSISDPSIRDKVELARAQISKSDDLGEQLENALAENPFRRSNGRFWIVVSLLLTLAAIGAGVCLTWF